MKKAIYAYSGDPTTYGHIDIIDRASRAFDHVIVGIGVNPDKKYMFTLEERFNMARKSLSKYSNVKVVSFEGLLVDYAYEHNIDIIIRGVRDGNDFAYESELHEINMGQRKGIDTHVLFANPELKNVSSSNVKGILKAQGSVHDFVPLYVKEKLEERMLGQYIVGVTGEMGTGKSYLSDRFVELGKEKGIAVHNIDLDVIGHQILGELVEPRYIDIRKKIVNEFGKKVELEDGFINRKVLGDIVFNDYKALEKLNSYMEEPMLVRLNKEMYGKKGLILFNAALIAETDMSYISNNNTILLYSDKDTQENRLKKKGLTEEQIERRLKSQFDFEKKKKMITDKVKDDTQGVVWIVENSENNSEIDEAFEKVVEELGVLKN